ncbi:MAG: PH domain-containing protein [Nitrospirae bacterium]|nr:PH domain-containing protein [Nitrospirota bacterium]
MEPIVVRPEKEQRTMWFIGWGILFVLGLVLGVVLLLTVDKLFFGLCLVGWLIFMSLILLWIPAFYKSLEYIIDSDSVKMRQGVFWRKRVTVPYAKITNIDVTQGPVQRMFNIGTIHIQTAGAGGPQGAHAELKLVGVRDLDGLKDAIMERVRGYTISRPEETRKEIAEESDSKIFKHILKELTAIREVLEKRQG